ncbi:phosphate-selective porin OprO and OprP [Methylobacterium sp. ap11]|uniref:OprO/OprP family phosphate-selective porin n=1 Tax=Methylobacterium sp. ap11 TaxID=1761799 RepID=UPI0008B6B7C8|nr:porin [Methylobacterium sp. ap11]SEP49338.1 phosphate-selective porin OprO and OprP [Methylobacterium sp. ap11]
MSHPTRPPSRPSWPIAVLLLACCASLPAGAVEGPPGPFGERLTIDEKGITLKFPDDAATLRIGGRLQLDFGTGRVQQRGFGTVFDTPIAVRRSWIESYLTLGKELELAFQYDFAEPNRPINDAVVAYKGFQNVIVAIGNMKEPFSLDQLISDNNTLFTERSLADAFAPARNFGFAIGTHGERWTAVTSVFGGNINNAAIGDQGVASTTRLTYAPYLSQDGNDVLHLGVAGSYRSLPNDGSALTLSSRSEAFLFARQFVNTGAIRDATSIGRIGLEAAWQAGPFRLQAEYILTEIGRSGGAPSLSFQGGYIQAGLLLNGKGRRYAIAPKYATEYAVFGGVEVEEAQRVSRGGTGVFELGLRYSAIDLEDRAIRGGIEQDFTAGVNWYPDRNIRFVFDYVRSHTSPSPASLNFNRRTIDADVFIGRAQLYW